MSQRGQGPPEGGPDGDVTVGGEPGGAGPAAPRHIGRQLGVYQIVASIGAGGMGEVYRARDTRLGRDVAIKLLPHGFADDPDRLQRFDREARVLASLNHPNIATIHGIEERDGTFALVMEIVEGETLAERIRGAYRGGSRSSLTITEILNIARQVADALDAAHEKGIVHRDLKPANVKITPEGIVKVLDFGLAKAAADGAPGTMETFLGTEPGMVMGTPAYMSPEQARGEPVGPQTDVWAFGVVLYEMLTGVSPFARKSPAETLAQVLELQPDYSRMPAAVPASLAAMVRRCLEKNRRARLQHMGDLRIQIEELIAVPASTSSRSVEAPAHRRRDFRPAVALAVAAVFAAGFGGWYAGQRSSQAPLSTGVLRLSVPFVDPPRLSPIGARNIAISDDGSTIAYAAQSKLWIRRLSEQAPLALPGVGGIPFFSPDGAWVAVGLDTGLAKIPVAGGPPQYLARGFDRLAGGDWGTDGTIVFASSAGLHRVSSDGGEVRLLASPDRGRKERVYAWPELLPGGTSLLFTIISESANEPAQIASLDLETLETHVVLKNGSSPRYLESGHLVFASGSVLKVVEFDARTHTTRGEPVPLSQIDVARGNDNGAAGFAVSPGGTLVYLAPTAAAPRTLSWVDRNGKEEPIAVAPAFYNYPRVSPDGTRVAVEIATAGNRDIWTLNLQRLTLTQLTNGPGEDLLAVWTPDSSRVFFGSDRGGGPFDIYSQAADGATDARLELARPGVQLPNVFTPDGTRLLVSEQFLDVGVLSLTNPPTFELLLKAPDFEERLAQVSLDGKWVAYESNESGDRFEVFVRPFPDVNARREQISLKGGRFPRWSPSGKELYYVTADGDMMAVPVTFSPSLTLGRAAKLFFFQALSGNRSAMLYDVAPDGRFIFTRPMPASATGPTQVSVVLNLLNDIRQMSAR